MVNFYVAPSIIALIFEYFASPLVISETIFNFILKTYNIVEFNVELRGNKENILFLFLAK
jgi:hypothetical protein